MFKASLQRRQGAHEHIRQCLGMFNGFFGHSRSPCAGQTGAKWEFAGAVKSRIGRRAHMVTQPGLML